MINAGTESKFPNQVLARSSGRYIYARTRLRADEDPHHEEPQHRIYVCSSQKNIPRRFAHVTVQPIESGVDDISPLDSMSNVGSSQMQGIRLHFEGVSDPDAAGENGNDILR